jgi:hypothetical protein
MKISISVLEAKLLGQNVISVSDIESVEELYKIEGQLISKYNPSYIYAIIDAIDVEYIQFLEEKGYHFSEFRVKSSLLLEEEVINLSTFYPYQAELVGDYEYLNQAKAILSDAKSDDRYSRDPKLGKELSLTRNIKLLEKSFNSYPNEFLLGVINSHNDELVAFRTGTFLNKKEAHFYQYGIKHGMDFNHISSILESLTFEFLSGRGINIVHAVSTGFNIDELNRLIANHGFEIRGSFVLLRKVFG